MADLTQTLAELIDGGEWACSYGQTGTLRVICHELLRLNEQLGDGELAHLAERCCALAASDMTAAGHAWAVLEDHLQAVRRLRNAALTSSDSPSMDSAKGTAISTAATGSPAVPNSAQPGSE